MRNRYMIVRIYIATYLFLQTSIALAALPYATGNLSLTECVDAIKLAKAMYHSTAQRLYAPLSIPMNLGSTLALGTSEMDISGGDALINTKDFEKLPENIRSIYWEKKVDGALRIVVREISLGWRGDMYYLYLLDASVKKDDFLKDIRSTLDNSPYQPIISDAWRPPLIFQHNLNKPKWLVDVGQPYQILSDWHVYTSKEKNPICTISFSPHGKNPLKLLPEPVTEFAQSLDKALGPGNDEGTLQPTARTRLDANHVLANAALRPWALTDGNAYNSREEVDIGLREWATVNNARHRLYREIQREYPLAVHSLATYYERVYGLSPKKAQQAAVWVIDLIYRSYFVFSNGQGYFRYDGVRTNPWPLKH